MANGCAVLSSSSWAGARATTLWLKAVPPQKDRSLPAPSFPRTRKTNGTPASPQSSRLLGSSESPGPGLQPRAPAVPCQDGDQQGVSGQRNKIGMGRPPPRETAPTLSPETSCPLSLPRASPASAGPELWAPQNQELDGGPFRKLSLLQAHGGLCAAIPCCLSFLFHHQLMLLALTGCSGFAG